MHPKFLRIRARLFRYRLVEQQEAARPGVRRLLDVGCGDGENLLRFRALPLERVGLELSWPRLVEARGHGLAVCQGSGTRLPFPAGSFDLIYIAHVLHHIADYRAALAEARRCLAPGGRLFLVETVTDHPLLRLARAVHPVWRGDRVEASWDYATLAALLAEAGFRLRRTGRYNVLFFLWEMLPLAFWPFELLTPFFVYLDLLLEKLAGNLAAHCYFVLERSEG